jgi:Coenzyme PQQ synthesis protein D (PqqD)
VPEVSGFGWEYNRWGLYGVETYTDVSIVRRAVDQVSCDMAGEAIVLNMKSGVYFGMEQVAALIWNLVEKPRSVAEIRDAIMKEYEVDDDTCEKDLKLFLDHLQSAGLIEIDNNEAGT